MMSVDVDVFGAVTAWAVKDEDMLRLAGRVEGERLCRNRLAYFGILSCVVCHK